ncbi:MAG: hypothetical protein KF743_14235 [Fimbriimonadaceae bacterium]|nr:hypothetical protein [Fimbriimonadaceae bacterium]
MKYVDASFQILTPRGTTFPGLDFQIPIFEWQGEEHPQGPSQCTFGAYFLLREEPVQDYIIEMLSTDLRHIDWQCFSVAGDGLGRHRDSLYGERVEWQGDGLPQLIDTILGAADEWVFVLEANCDQIDRVISCGPGDVLSLIESALVVKEEGFLAMSK